MPYLHHIFLHFPIALSAAAALFAIFGWVPRGGAQWQAASRLTTYLAAATAALAIASGLASAAHFIDEGGAPSQVALHRNLALTAGTLLLLGAALVWRGTRAPGSFAARASAVLTVVAAAGVSIAAHFGGEMLHPGLAPWSHQPHHHGPGAADDTDHHGDMANHDHAEHPADASTMLAQRDGGESSTSVANSDAGAEGGASGVVTDATVPHEHHHHGQSDALHH